MNKNLFNKNFSLIVVGQIISIFVNSLLNFSLGLSILEITGSSETFGIVTAISILPWAICSPLGGVLSDKFNQRNIMIILDFSASLIIMSLIGFSFFSGSLPLAGIIVVKILLSGIQAAYSPSVLSAIVYIVAPEHITRANSITSQVNSICSILAPVSAGILYSFTSIEIVLLVSSSLFFFSAIIEFFIKIDKSSHTLKSNSNNANLSAAFAYFKENRNLTIFMFLTSLVNAITSAIIVIGLPVIINMFLKLSAEYYGIASGFVGAGSFLAGVILFFFAHKIKYRHTGYIYLVCAFSIVLLGFALFINEVFIAFMLLCVFILIIMMFSSSSYTLRNSYLQLNTPRDLLGKVMALTMILNGFFDPISQALYGYLFGAFDSTIPLIIIFSGLFIVPVSLISIKFSKNLK